MEANEASALMEVCWFYNSFDDMMNNFIATEHQQNEVV